MRKLFKSKRAVSPVLSTILMIVIVVIGMTVAFAFFVNYVKDYQAGSGSSVFESADIEDVWFKSTNASKPLPRNPLLCSPVGGTTLLFGTASYLASSDNVYMKFGSYASAFTPRVYTPVVAMSNIDGSLDKGTHSNFDAEKARDATYDNLTENDYTSLYIGHYIDQLSNVDGSADKGSHSNFNNQKATDGSVDTLQEQDTRPAASLEHFVDSNASNMDGASDKGTHSNFSNQKAKDNNYDTLTEGDYGTNKQDYVDQLSNVDGASDKGSHSNFSNQKAKDNNYDTLTEGDTSGWRTPVGINNKCGEDSNYPATEAIDGDTHSYWRHSATENHWIQFDMGQTCAVSRVEIYQSSTSSNRWGYGGSVTVYVSDNPANWGSAVLTGWNAAAGSGWQASSTFTAKNGRYIRLEEVGCSSQSSHRMYEFCAYCINYELDLEEQFTTVDYSQDNAQLCIYAGSLGSENLRVDYWTGSAWSNLFTALSSGWNNVTVSLTSSTFTIRFNGGSEASDTTQDSWQIDCTLLHTWNPPNYELDLEEQFINVDYNRQIRELCIYTGVPGSENLKVDVRSGSSWVTVISALQQNAWNNVSVPSYLTSATFTIRFKGSAETGDTTQDSWQIDAVLVHTGTAPDYELDLEVQWTNADYDETDEYLCIYTDALGSENLKVDVWAGSWITVISALQPNQWNNASVSSYLTSSTFTIRFKGYTETGDTTRDSWNIDCALLYTGNTPTRYTAEVEFTGSSDTLNWTGLDWTAECASTADSVSNTLQLYNYESQQYPTSGDGYVSYTSGAASLDQISYQNITVNPRRFNDTDGTWKLKIKEEKATSTQFNCSIDWIEFYPKVRENPVEIWLYNYGKIDLKITSVYVNGLLVDFGPVEIAVGEHGRLTAYLASKWTSGTTYHVKLITERGSTFEGEHVSPAVTP
jgi:hypothetical protein